VKRVIRWRAYPFDTIIKQFGGSFWGGRLKNRPNLAAKQIGVGLRVKVLQARAQRFALYKRRRKTKAAMFRSKRRVLGFKLTARRQVRPSTRAVRARFKKMLSLVDTISSQGPRRLYEYFHQLARAKIVN
jgi:hypothetical protein